MNYQIRFGFETYFDFNITLKQNLLYHTIYHFNIICKQDTSILLKKPENLLFQ